MLGMPTIRAMKSVKDLGGPSAVARALGLSSPTVCGWSKIPEWHCPALEREHEGRVTVEEMRPDVPWLRVPDPDWPHKAGRPVVDHARARRKKATQA